MDTTLISKNENLQEISDRRSILFRSPAPSAFIICGFIAVVNAFDKKPNCPETCPQIPKAALIAVPKKRFNNIAVPCVRPTMHIVP